VATWPPLAWLAICVRRHDEVTVFVGPRVEVTDDWVCEGIWDAPYADGDLDRTDLVFGSGVRLRGDVAMFVVSGTTLDRLHAWDAGGHVYVSNSLPCILSLARGSLDPSCVQYRQLARSIMRGLDDYARDLPTTVGPIRLTYFDNLAWDGQTLCEVPKPSVRRDLSTFEAYRTFLDKSMERVSANARSEERAQPFGLIATLSSGYDSPTVTVLARGVGCLDVFGFDRARGGLDDSGEPIARLLGVRYHAVDTAAWRSHRLAAVPFLAAIASGGSSVPYKGAEPLLAGKVVFTGYFGDKVWGTKATDAGDEFVRRDTAGVDLTEYRLWAGFVHCPVPFFGARQIGDIHAISTSPALASWNAKPSYNRPICRRIVEEAGVPGNMFAVRKKATAQPVLRAEDFLTRDMRSDYYRWVRARRRTLISRGQRPPSVLVDLRILARARVAVLAERAHQSAAAKRLGRRAEALLGRLSAGLGSDPGRVHHQYVFHWAVDRAKERYPDPQLLGRTS
jgi:hypothetical protein